MPKPDEKPEHPVKEDHPGQGRGENPNPGNRPDKPVDPATGQPYPDNALPGEQPQPNQDLPEEQPIPPTPA